MSSLRRDPSWRSSLRSGVRTSHPSPWGVSLTPFQSKSIWVTWMEWSSQNTHSSFDGSLVGFIDLWVQLFWVKAKFPRSSSENRESYSSFIDKHHDMEKVTYTDDTPLEELLPKLVDALGLRKYQRCIDSMPYCLEKLHSNWYYWCSHFFLKLILSCWHCLMLLSFSRNAELTSQDLNLWALVSPLACFRPSFLCSNI